MDTKYKITMEVMERDDGYAIVKFFEHRPHITLGVLITAYRPQDRHLLEADFDALSRMPYEYRTKALSQIRRRPVGTPIVYDDGGHVVSPAEPAQVERKQEISPQVGFDQLWG